VIPHLHFKGEEKGAQGFVTAAPQLPAPSHVRAANGM
jgi:hypothetical protein